mmetsp:Transcript_7051/g.16042  ORF Transcript_7051/g.16042 Transcript_7051/m.16042 type:complete len:175 (-) Transcript_7051:223-747(-)
MECIVMIGDELLGKKILSSYLSANPRKMLITDALMDQLQSFIDRADAINPIFVSSVNATRFSADPTSAANFLIKYCNTLGAKTANMQLTENLIEAFVDSLCPPDKISLRVPSKNINSFPLNAILGLFICGKHSKLALAKRVVAGYVWLSCQQISESNGYFHILVVLRHPEARNF